MVYSCNFCVLYSSSGLHGKMATLASKAPLLRVVLLVFCLQLTCVMSSSRGQQEEPPVRYDGYQLWRVFPGTKAELKQLDRLETKYEYSVWRPTSRPGRPVDIMIPPLLVSRLAPEFNQSFASFEVLQTDIQAVIDQQFSDNTEQGDEFAYDKYHRLKEIDGWMNDMVTAYPNLVSKGRIGKSYEDRSMYMLKIATGTGTAQQNRTASSKSGIFIQGGIHAREWISPATVIYMTNQLLKRYGTDPVVTSILNAFDWYVLPVFNVDGYEYTWTHNRLWRKTRSPNGIPLCKGTDPNRNWDNHWGGAGASGNPCSETYYGSKPFSEVEVRAVADFLLTRKFVGFIDFHSYSQLWMTAWGYTEEYPPDFKIQDAQSTECVRALTAVHGTPYEHGTIANTIYLEAGNSVDWAYYNAGILYAATVELRDRGEYGFLLPDDQIVPTGEETLAGLIQYALYLLE